MHYYFIRYSFKTGETQFFGSGFIQSEKLIKTTLETVSFIREFNPQKQIHTIDIINLNYLYFIPEGN